MTPEITCENFQPVVDILFVEANPDKGREHKMSNGVTLLLDNRYNPHQTWNTTQCGEVKMLPLKLSKGKEMRVKQGDKVYFHHFGCNTENKVLINDKPYYKMSYESLYCKVNGTVEMLNDYNLIEPILESEEDIRTKSGIWLKGEAQAKMLCGTARFLTKEMKSQGIKDGDVVYFERNADCELLVEGKSYYRVKNRSFLFVLNGKDIKPVYDYVAVKKNEIQQERSSGIIIPLSAEKREVKATVVAVGVGKDDYDMNCKVGDEVLISNNAGTEVMVGQEKLFLFKEEHIYGILN